jgi:hypothetical protein
MSVIVPPSVLPNWFGEDIVDRAKTLKMLLAPYSAGDMVIWLVGRRRHRFADSAPWCTTDLRDRQSCQSYTLKT